MLGMNIQKGAVTSEGDALFLFPDLRTALVGEFNSNAMVAARETRVVAERCRRGLKEVKVARPKPEAPVYTYFRPTEIRYGSKWSHYRRARPKYRSKLSLLTTLPGLDCNILTT